MFQSPSLRGSGRFTLELLYESLRKYEFQSPSLRGSGRFPWPATGPCPSSSGFNPLHCGAVVASGENTAEARVDVAFQSPSLRGSGRFDDVVAGLQAVLEVSIPFIAGQWSLLHFSREDEYV